MSTFCYYSSQDRPKPSQNHNETASQTVKLFHLHNRNDTSVKMFWDSLYFYLDTNIGGIRNRQNNSKYNAMQEDINLDGNYDVVE